MHYSVPVLGLWSMSGLPHVDIITTLLPHNPALSSTDPPDPPSRHETQFQHLIFPTLTELLAEPDDQVGEKVVVPPDGERGVAVD